MPSKLFPTRKLPHQNEYTLGLLETYKEHAVDEERAPTLKGKWRSEIFSKYDKAMPLDLEIGTGNGWFFKRHLETNADRLMIGLELRYKPLIQTVRSCLKSNIDRGCLVRYNAYDLMDLFEPAEISNVYMFFPDPWTSPRKPKNRLPGRKMFELLSVLQKPGSFLSFKTDSEELFDWANEEVKGTPYSIEVYTRDFWKDQNADRFLTQFETYFVRQGLPIYHFMLKLKN